MNCFQTQLARIRIGTLAVRRKIVRNRGGGIKYSGDTVIQVINKQLMKNSSFFTQKIIFFKAKDQTDRHK